MLFDTLRKYECVLEYLYQFQFQLSRIKMQTYVTWAYSLTIILCCVIHNNYTTIYIEFVQTEYISKLNKHVQYCILNYNLFIAIHSMYIYGIVKIQLTSDFLPRSINYNLVNILLSDRVWSIYCCLIDKSRYRSKQRTIIAYNCRRNTLCVLSNI